MKNLIPIVLISILILLIIYFYFYFYIHKIKININNNLNNNLNQNQNKENFLNLENYSFLGLDESKKLFFYNKTNNKYYKRPIINNNTIQNFLYYNKILVVLSTYPNNNSKSSININSISYMNNSDLTNPKSKMTELKLVDLIKNTPIKKIAFDTENENNLFILFDFDKSKKNNLYIIKNFDTLPEILSVQLPKHEDYFIDFDAKYGKLVGIGNHTNLIYQTDINKKNFNFKKINWNILDKNHNINNILITVYGYIGNNNQTKKYYLCNQFNNYKWTLINNFPENSEIIDIDGSSIDGISILINDKNINTLYLYIYDESKSEFKPITTFTDNKFIKVKIIDYIFPIIKTVPFLVPLDEKNLLVYNNNIKNDYDIKYQQMGDLLLNIKKNINIYYQNQLDFNENKLKKKIDERDDIINSFKTNIGFGFKENFEDINLFNKINNKLTYPQPTEIVNGNVKKKIVGEDLIINFP